jgi:adenylate cyclase
MRDEEKTKEQLMDELLELRRQNSELERKFEASKETEEWYRDLADNANDLIQSVTADGRFLYVNRSWCNTFGYSKEDVAGLSLFDIIHPGSQAHCIEMFHRVVSGERVNDVEATFIAKDGREINVEGSARCRFVDGKPLATWGIFRDVTGRK